MKFGIIVVIAIILIAIIGLVVYLYYTYEKPAQEDLARHNVNLNIYATDQEKQVETGYTVESMGLIINGTTSNTAAEVEEIPVNQSIKVYNVNLEGQNYYTTTIEKTLTDLIANERINLKLVKAGNLTIIRNNASDINLTILTDKSYRNLHMCAHWGLHIITIRTGLQEVDKPDQYSAYDRCYTFAQDLNDSLNFVIKYTFFDVLDKRDFLNLVFYDEDCLNGVCQAFVNNQDIGGTNLVYNINNI